MMLAPCTLVLLMVALFSVSQAGNLSGDFSKSPKDGAVCRWFEGGSGTKTKTRSFRVVCNFPEEPEKGKKKGKKEKKVEKKGYECTYKGNPHDCKAYNKNQEAYYQCLSDEAAENAENACSHGSLVCDSGKFKKCGDVTMVKQSSLKKLLFEKTLIEIE